MPSLHHMAKCSLSTPVLTVMLLVSMVRAASIYRPCARALLCAYLFPNFNLHNPLWGGRYSSTHFTVH